MSFIENIKDSDPCVVINVTFKKEDTRSAVDVLRSELGQGEAFGFGGDPDSSLSFVIEMLREARKRFPDARVVMFQFGKSEGGRKALIAPITDEALLAYGGQPWRVGAAIEEFEKRMLPPNKKLLRKK